MKTLNFIMQGKGGVGKSFIASLLTQYYRFKNVDVLGFDTDPVNQTFTKYKGLKVEQVNIMTEHKTIDTSRFDEFMQNMVEQAFDVAVIDNGAATFVPLMQYLAENDVFELLASSGINVLFHIPIVGGQAYKDTVFGANQILNQFHGKALVWLNNYFAPTQTPQSPFENTGFYQRHQQQIIGKILLPQLNPDTFAKDIRSMTELHLTFDEALSSQQFSLFPKNRLAKVRKTVFDQLNQFSNSLGIVHHEKPIEHQQAT